MFVSRRSSTLVKGQSGVKSFQEKLKPKAIVERYIRAYLQHIEWFSCAAERVAFRDGT
jgi:hypothetical protein